MKKVKLQLKNSIFSPQTCAAGTLAVTAAAKQFEIIQIHINCEIRGQKNGKQSQFGLVPN